MRRLITLSFVYCMAVGATTVYKSVDENGVVTFSDTFPEGDVQVEILEIDAPPPQDPNAYQEELEAMDEATEQMVADRMARERHRAELREIEARTEAYRVRPEPVYDPDPYNRYLPLYTGRRDRIRHHPEWQPGPEYPATRPPLRPVDSAPNDQLMRPIVSSSGSGADSSNAQLMRPLVSSGP